MNPTIIEDNIDMWYDCLTDCYENNMPFYMIADYLDGITDEDTARMNVLPILPVMLCIFDTLPCVSRVMCLSLRHVVSLNTVGCA